MVLASIHSKETDIKDSFYNSVNYDPIKDLLSFTVPKTIPEGYKFYLHISGLRFMGENNPQWAFHVFDEESINYTWEHGKTYNHFECSGGFEYISLNFGLLDKNTKKLLYSYTITVFPTGTKTIEKD